MSPTTVAAGEDRSSGAASRPATTAERIDLLMRLTEPLDPSDLRVERADSSTDSPGTGNDKSAKSRRRCCPRADFFADRNGGSRIGRPGSAAGGAAPPRADETDPPHDSATPSRRPGRILSRRRLSDDEPHYPGMVAARAAQRAALARVRDRTRRGQLRDPTTATTTLTRLCPYPERPYDDDPAPHTLAGRRKRRRPRCRSAARVSPDRTPTAHKAGAAADAETRAGDPASDESSPGDRSAAESADGSPPGASPANDSTARDSPTRDSPTRDSAASESADGDPADGAPNASAVPHQSGAHPFLDAGFDDGELIDLIQSTQRLVGYVTAVQARAMSALAQRSEPINGHDHGFRGHDDISAFVEDEVSLACGVSRQSGCGRIEVALALTERLPQTLRALELGDIDWVKARIMADETDRLTAPQAASVERLVVDELTGPGLTCSYRRWEIRIREAVAAVDPTTAEERRQQAKAARQVEYLPDEDGMARLNAFLPAPTARSIYAMLTKHALANPGDDRTLDQRRADAFVDLILGRVAPSARKPLIQVTVAATTLLGLDRQPAQLAGHGPITAEVARELAADGTWRRLLTDPKSGALLDYGRRLYRPPAAMARHVRAAHQVCRFPGCDRAADACDLDHRIAFPAGPTSAANLRPLCRHHHRAKSNRPWYDERLGDGSVLWISPTGHGWIDPPRRVQPKSPAPVEKPTPDPADDPPPF